MVRILSTLSLLLASGVVVAAETDVTPTREERPTITVFGELRSGGNGFNPVYTFGQPLPQKRMVRRDAAKKVGCEEQRDSATPSRNEGGIQEI